MTAKNQPDDGQTRDRQAVLRPAAAQPQIVCNRRGRDQQLAVRGRHDGGEHCGQQNSAQNRAEQTVGQRAENGFRVRHGRQQYVAQEPRQTHAAKHHQIPQNGDCAGLAQRLFVAQGHETHHQMRLAIGAKTDTQATGNHAAGHQSSVARGPAQLLWRTYRP